MNYLSQPITGLLTKTSQLFSGRVTKLFGYSSGLTLKIKLQILSSTKYFQLGICSGWTINEYPAIANTDSLCATLNMKNSNAYRS
jgi:hypothetical protein